MRLQSKRLAKIFPTQVGPRKVVRFVWSAILDKKTCPLCRSLDGKVINASDRAFSTFHPPIHQNCRCLWIGICEDDPHIPEPNWPSLPPDLLSFANLKSIGVEEKTTFSLLETKNLTPSEFDKFVKRYGALGWTKQGAWSPRGMALRRAVNEVILRKPWKPINIKKLSVSEFEELVKSAENIYKKYGDLIKAGVRKLYEQTQNVIGGKRLTLYRGVGSTKIVVDSMSSWTEDKSVANMFAFNQFMISKPGESYILKIEVDSKYVLTCYKSHPNFFANYNEKEFILLDEAMKDPSTKITVAETYKE